MLAAEQEVQAEKQRNQLQFLNSTDSMFVLLTALVDKKVAVLLSPHSSLLS